MKTCICRRMSVFALMLSLSFSTSSKEVDPTSTPTPEDADVDGRVASLLDVETTNEMHDDTTVLRNIRVLEDETGLVLFDALRIWVGGAVQYDYFNFDGVYSHENDGERAEGGSFRRLEVVLRSQLYDWGEIKAQYDLDSGVAKDIYFRWVSERPNTPVTITVGNQNEPMGLDLIMGNKFAMAQESSAPSNAFGDWRSLGVRLHRAFQTDREDRALDIFDDDEAFVTTTIGIFTEDLESSNNTDLAVTGRVTGGRMRDGVGVHLGLSASYREGEFRHVKFKPEISHADRITLAEPDADTMGIAGLEAAYNHGPLHFQVEAYYARYQGSIDGYGGGGYVQAGWFLTGESREYNARWGVLAPHNPSRKWSTEVFARFSHTRGDDDLNDWNDYKSVTLGTNLYHRKLRVSLNLLYGDIRRPIRGEEDGVALNARAQYVF